LLLFLVVSAFAVLVGWLFVFFMGTRELWL